MAIGERFKQFLIRTVNFIKTNIIIVYSLFLLILIPAAFFANTYFTNLNYGQAIDFITQKKVAMIEDVINGFVGGRLDDPAKLQTSIDRVMENAGYDQQGIPEIMEISILVPAQKEGDYKVIASSDSNLIGKVQEQLAQNRASWAFSKQAIVYLDQNEGGRFWKATRPLLDEMNREVGLVNVILSINNQDAVMNEVISNSYWILFLTLLVVILLVANQARLVTYASTVAKLKEIDKMKDMFISMASHELRSPLTAIKGYLDLLTGSRNLNLDAETGRYVENIKTSAQRLENLVEDILDVSRLEGNRLPIEITSFDPLPAISKSIEEMRAAAIQKGLLLEYKPGASVKILADESRIKQIIVNLIGNAVKYTEKGKIEIATAIKKDGFNIIIADTGIGMSADDQADLFKKFYRIKNDKTRNISGTGLGLWITKTVVEKMGGKINVESIEGVGSHFTIWLPLSTKK